MALSEDLVIEKLKAFTSCDVSDALCKLGHATGGFLPGLTMWSPRRQEGDTKVIGPAYTVKYVAVEDPRPKMQGHYIDSVPSGAVIFISSPPTPNAVYGGLMSTRAQVRGAVGVVIDGRFRDLEEQRSLGFPVFARDIGTAPPYNAVKVIAVNEQIRLKTSDADTVVNPEDYIVADLNGVVVLPRGLAEEVLILMTKQVEADSKMAVGVKNGMSFVEASKRFR